MAIANRIMMPAMHLNYHRDGCFGDDRLVAFYRERARGRAGLISIGGFAVDPAGAGVFKSLLLGLWNDGFIPDLRRLTNAMREANPQGKVACQLYHTGRVSPSRLTGLQPVAVSAIPSRFNPEPLHVLSTDEVAALERKYVEAAIRAQEAGFDCIDVFCGVGHLIAQFLSPVTNDRTDRYGGSLENRARFATNVVAAIREALPGVPVLVRLAGSDLLPGGNTHHDVARIAGLLEAAGADAFNVTGGWHESRVPQITGDVPTGAYAWLAETVRAAVGVPVAASNRINDPDVAERILRENRADFISMGRPLLADPHLPRKLIDGEPEQINHCIACNVCLDSAWSGPARCLVNPSAGREAEAVAPPSAARKRVLVVGGGPAGLMAAKVAAARGHAVELWEKEPRLGGVAAIGDVAPGKREYRWVYEDLVRQVSLDQRIDVRLGREATLESVRAARPEVLIVATGGNPVHPDLPVPNGARIEVLHAHDVLAGAIDRVGRDVVVLGGGPTACETALHIKEHGSLDGETVKFLLVHRLVEPDELRRMAMTGIGSRNVSVVQRSGRFAKDLNKSVRWTLLESMEAAGIRSFPSSTVRSIEADALVIVNSDGEETRIACDTIVVAVGVRAENRLYEEVRAGMRELPAFLIGDAASPRQATEALLEGWQVANSL
ncbi:MAG: FAD-dependent oxidoreductase [Burkholderiaceae bacterium]|nr:FAD-dependent oxidoreductase [Burkholderiaceae bacterium]